MDLINLLLILVLIIATGFFVAAEFAIVKVRPTRIEQLAEQGSKRAIAARKVIGNIDGYLSACQLGITITALGLGWVGEPTIEHILHPVFAAIGLHPQLDAILSFILAFGLITFLHVVVGELAPKTIAIQKAEQISLWTAQPLIYFYKIMYPFIWLLNGSARQVTRFLGLTPANEHDIAHTEEEIRSILNQSYSGGQINKEELNYMNNIFQFDDRLAKEIMVPRTEISAVDLDAPMSESMKIIKNEKFTRFPVIFNGDKDQIVGIINTKELFHALLDGQADSMQEFLRPVLTVPETIPIRDLLKKMQKEGNHMSILIDEYGGTAGLVTVEDILEEIVGEIRDEFDYEEEPLVCQISPYHVIVDGKVLVSDINQMLKSSLDDADIDTIGGWVYTHANELTKGMKIAEDDLTFTVLDVDHHKVKKIEIEKQNHDIRTGDHP